MMMMIAPNSLAHNSQGEGKEEAGDQRKGGQIGNSDTRGESSHKSISVRGFGCEEQGKTWTVVWDSTPHKVQS